MTRANCIRVIIIASVLAVAATAGVSAEVLTILTHGHPVVVDPFKVGAEIFEQANPDWKVEFIVGGKEQLLTMVIGGNPPDLINVIAGEIPEYMHMELLSAAPALIEEDLAERFLPETYQHLCYKGKIYGYPTEFQVITLMTNPELFDAMGIPLEITYWTDLDDIQRRMMRYDTEGVPEKAAISLARRGIWGILHFSPIFWGCGADYFDDEGHPTLDTPEALAAVKLFEKLVVMDGSKLGGFYNGNNLGLALHTPTGRWDIEHYNTPHPVVPLEKPPMDPDGTRVTAFYTWNLHVIDSSPNRVKAWELAKCLNSHKVKRALTEVSGLFPVTREMLEETVAYDPWFDSFLPWAQAIRQWPMVVDFYNHADGGIADRAILSQIDRFLRDEIDPRTALITADQLTKAELSKLMME